MFGVKERNGRVRVCVVKDAGAATLAANAARMVKRGSVIYTDRWVGYNTLVLAGFRHRVINHREFHRFGNVHTNGIEGFWSYARERLAKYHGVNPENFGYYIKEIEWRYNNRDGDLDLALLGCLLSPS